MARRFWIRTADNAISGMSDIDTVAVPAGHTAVLESVIRSYDPPGATGRIQSGTFTPVDGYAPPSAPGISIRPDPTTDIGRKIIALTALYNWLVSEREKVLQVQSEKPRNDTATVHDFFAMAHWAAHVVATMHTLGTITIEQLEAWCLSMARGPDGYAGRQSFYMAANEVNKTPANVPQEACAWASPFDASRVPIVSARAKSSQNDDAWFTGRVTDLYMVDLGHGAWIRRLNPAQR